MTIDLVLFLFHLFGPPLQPPAGELKIPVVASNPELKFEGFVQKPLKPVENNAAEADAQTEISAESAELNSEEDSDLQRNTTTAEETSKADDRRMVDCELTFRTKAEAEETDVVEVEIVEAENHEAVSKDSFPRITSLQNSQPTKPPQSSSAEAPTTPIPPTEPMTTKSPPSSPSESQDHEAGEQPIPERFHASSGGRANLPKEIAQIVTVTTTESPIPSTTEGLSLWEKISGGIRCSLRDCEDVLRPTEPTKRLLNQWTIIRRVRRNQREILCRCPVL